MKTKIITSLIILAVYLCSSCSSSDNDEADQSLLSQMGITNPVTCIKIQDEDGSYTSNFQYENNRLIYVSCKNFSAHISYNPLSIEGQNKYGKIELSNYKTNKMGYLTEFTITYNENDGNKRSEFVNMEYDNQGYLIFFTSDYIENDERTYEETKITREDENITKITDIVDTTTIAFQFVYDNNQKDNGTFYIDVAFLYNPENMGAALCYAGLLGKPSKLVPTLLHFEENTLNIDLSCNEKGLVKTIETGSNTVQLNKYTFDYDTTLSRATNDNTQIISNETKSSNKHNNSIFR